MTAARAAGIAAGVLADAAFGDPRRGHPVALFGAAAGRVERVMWRDDRTAGGAYLGVCLLPVVGGASIAQRAARRSAIAEAALIAAAVWTALGGHSLRAEAGRMHAALTAGDLPGARERLTHLCARDPAGLGPDELARATVESIAENTSDAVVAPLVWAALAGVPGVLAYRAVNTLDAMVGYRSARYARFGWAAARLDDVANLLPARLTAVITVFTAPFTRASATGAGRVWRRDGRAHPSPNAGHCEAAFAGALGVRLGGTNRYGTQVENRPGLGDGPAPGVGHLPAAQRLAHAVGVAAAVTAVLAALLRRSR